MGQIQLALGTSGVSVSYSEMVLIDPGRPRDLASPQAGSVAGVYCAERRLRRLTGACFSAPLEVA